MKLRFHNDTTHAKYSPQGEIAAGLYEALETARCEALGARALPYRGNQRISWCDRLNDAR